MHILAGHRGSRHGKRKSAYTSRTLKPSPQDALLRQKVHTLGSPRFALFCMHTRPPPLCGRLRKSAYTRRTPQRQPQPAKSVHTSLPRVLYKKYAYYPDTIRQKVHTLGGHLPEILPEKSVHTRLPTGFPHRPRNAAGKKCTPKPAPRLADAATTLRPPEPCRAAKPGILARHPLFSVFFCAFLFVL